MPSSSRSNTGVPPEGASAEQILREVLPVVITAASKSAEAATAAAAAIQTFDGQMSETKTAVEANTAAIRDLKTAIEAQNQNTAEKNAWLRTLFQPQFLFPFLLQLLFIVLGLAGIRYANPETEQLQKLLKEQAVLIEQLQKKENTP